MAINFNGRISEWEAACVEAVGTMRDMGASILNTLIDIRNAVSLDSPEVKTLSYRGTANTYATGNYAQNGTLIPNHNLGVFTVPSGQEYVIRHVGCDSSVKLFLDDRIVGTFGLSTSVEIVIGPGRLSINSAVDGVDFMVQAQQRTSNIQKVAVQGHSTAGMQTKLVGGGVDQTRHYDTGAERIQTPQIPNR